MTSFTLIDMRSLGKIHSLNGMCDTSVGNDFCTPTGSRANCNVAGQNISFYPKKNELYFLLGWVQDNSDGLQKKTTWPVKEDISD